MIKYLIIKEAFLSIKKKNKVIMIMWIRVCKENDCMIFYSSVSEASSLKPIFRIYVIPDFYNYFQLELTEKIKLKKDSFISTDYKNDSAKAKIISLPLYENIEIRSILKDILVKNTIHLMK